MLNESNRDLKPDVNGDLFIQAKDQQANQKTYKQSPQNMTAPLSFEKTASFFPHIREQPIVF